jgi:glycosyltransferase involved in cell wall biosynthesis
MNKTRVFFVTETDLGAPFVGGGMVNDLKTIRSLEKLSEVSVIYLQKLKYVPMLLALLIFIVQLMRSLSKPSKIYVSRSLIASTILLVFRPVAKVKIIHQALSVPFPSSEVKFIPRDERARVGSSGLELQARYRLIRLMEDRVLPNVDCITVAAPEYVHELVKFGVEKDKIAVVPFYVENEFHKVPVKRYSNSVFTFGYVGAFHQYHDVTSLVEAFEVLSQTHHDVELLLVGDGPTRSQIEHEVSHRNLSQSVKFHGSIPHASMPSLLSRMDVFVLLTRAPGLPIGLLEAAAAGKPIIAVKPKRDDALSRFFKHEQDVYFAASSSPTEIAAAMDLLYRDANLRHSLASHAKETARRYFTEDMTFQRLQNVLTRL